MKGNQAEPEKLSTVPPDLGGDLDPVELIARALECSCTTEATGKRMPAEPVGHAFPADGKNTGGT